MTAAPEQLLARIAKGDQDALGALYDRYASTLFPVALRIMRSRAEAEDVLHDAFVIVSERASQYAAERGSVVSWLVTLVRNLCIDRARRHERRGLLIQKEARESASGDARPADVLIDDAAERARVRAALAILPAAQRETLLVAFFEGLSYPEIAERDGVPLGTIKSRAARAMAALREELEKGKTK